MVYSRELAKKFWFEFDLPFNSTFGDIGIEMKNLLRIAGEVANKYRRYFDRSSGILDMTSFETAIKNMRRNEQILQLAGIQLNIINNSFNTKSDKADLDNAFADFGQGVLYDIEHDNIRTARDRAGNPMYYPGNRNIMIFRIHKMDSRGMWGWWHSFIRGTIVAGADNITWFEMNKLVAYAYVIDSIVKPKQSFEFPNGEIPANHHQYPEGPGSPDAISVASPILLSSSFEELDHILGPIV